MGQFSRPKLGFADINTATKIPTVWDQLAENLYLKDSPTAQVRLSELASFSFGRFQSSEGLPEIARPIVGERATLLLCNSKAIPYIEQFLGNKRCRVVLIRLEP